MKKGLLLIIFALVMGACSLDQNRAGEEVKVINIALTDDPAVNAALPLYSEEDLQIMGLATGEAVIESGSIHSYGRGPLFDNRGVKGKMYTFSIYSGDTNQTYSVVYGFTPGNLDQTVSTTNVYSSFYARIQIPSDAGDQIFWKVVDGSGVTYQNNASLWNAFLYDSIVSYSYSESYYSSINDGIFINYSGPATGNDTILHYGWNNWSQVTDVEMDWITNSSYSYQSDYSTVRVQFINGAEYLDFAFNGNGLWDNNFGQDYHTSVSPLVIVQPTGTYETSTGETYKSVSVSYANGDLGDDVWAHYGVDGWQNIAESRVYPYRYNGYVSKVYSCSVSVSADARVFDVAFRNDSGQWENNFGQDWHEKIDWK